ncbi:urokinase plasminogen activator surface receptor [Misgurnus anguillicaudatus]|uniref:urokinase plasminogen activator surface receptor n=1 Tax=Misgurnus anguillicaudatus TaxID=75329 RepID=UPI003CCF3710
MALHCIILLLTSVIFSKALALKCYGCVPDPSNLTCTDGQIVCQSQCSTMTMTVAVGNFRQSTSMKACGDPFSCVNGSINYGQSRISVNTQCCNTNLCNIKDAPELPRSPPNGKSCYSCDQTNCFKVLPCEGDENQCFTFTVEVNGKNDTQKGCSSKLFCGSFGSRALTRGRSGGYFDMKCCEGNLCNRAQNMRVFFFPLVSLIFLYFSSKIL